MAKPLDWEALLVKGYEPLKVGQRIFRRLPHDPRCKLCLNPFGGVGGKVCGLIGRKPSRKNPNLCQYCFDHLPTGGIEIDIGVVFADVRASTALGEQSNASAFAERLNEFYATATSVVIHNEGIVDKLIGDEVMGLFIQGVAGADYRRKAALAALELASEVTDLPLGVAANAGIAFVGNVGSGSVLDFTALGDAVNVGARLQAHVPWRGCPFGFALPSDRIEVPRCPLRPRGRSWPVPAGGRRHPDLGSVIVPMAPASRHPSRMDLGRLAI